MDQQKQSDRRHSFLFDMNQTAVLRVVWFMVALLVIGIVITAVPYRYQMLVDDVYHFGAALAEIGLTLHFFALYFVFWELVVIGGSLFVAAMIIWHGSDEPFAILVAIALTLYGLLTPLVDGLVSVDPRWAWVLIALRAITLTCLMAVFCLFPNGRFQPKWTRWLFVGFLLTLAILHLVKQDTLADMAILPNTRTLNDALFVLVGASWYLVAIGAQIYRYFGIATEEEKQQTKWVIFGFVVIVLFSLITAILLITIPYLRDDPEGRIIFTLIMGMLYLLSAMFFPITIALAMLRYRLWEVDIYINRTLVYGSITALILIVYVLLVGGMSSLFHTQNSLIISLLATGMIAVLFHPLRDRLQKGVNRFMFGERDDPYGVLSRLGRQLQKTTVPEQTLFAITSTITQTLKLPYAAIELDGLASEQQLIASSGHKVNFVETWPLFNRGDVIGWLRVATRSPGEDFTKKERQLLQDIATQAGAAAYSVRLTMTLQKSREKLVLAREEERRRIRRDLHDELGPSLASQTFALDNALDLLETDPLAAAELLRAMKKQNQTLVGDIRRLVYELRPPALDELGLMGALQAHIGQIAKPVVEITAVPDPLPHLSAAVEVAAYRIILEATTNVVRHAQAMTCRINLTAADSQLTVSITDDGCGIASNRLQGVGLRSMRERAEELGGVFSLKTTHSGTQITAVLPT